MSIYFRYTKVINRLTIIYVRFKQLSNTLFNYVHIYTYNIEHKYTINSNNIHSNNRFFITIINPISNLHYNECYIYEI